SAAQVAAAHAPIGVVQLRDASGRRTVPVAIGGDGALVLQLPAGAAAQRVGFRLERHVGDGGVPELWLEGNPRIAADATMRISGVPAGRYAVEVAFESDGERHTVRCADFTAPGTVDLSR
ncbi:MAG: hypothetical protein KDE27_11990, partial [Planctomycetes bacterium]|nr:hypothetical protein [Planctomycetota bacterium]